MTQKESMPDSIIIIIGIFASFGVLIIINGSSFFSQSVIMRIESTHSDMSNLTILMLSIPSMIVGFLYVYSAGIIWKRREGAWDTALFTVTFSLIVSILTTIFITTGFTILGVSWIVALFSAIIILLLLQSEVKEYLTEIKICKNCKSSVGINQVSCPKCRQPIS